MYSCTRSVIFAIFIVGSWFGNCAYGQELYQTYTFYKFNGYVEKAEAKDANDRSEIYYFLKMQNPIDVYDEDTKSKNINIDEVQLVFLSKVKTKYVEILNRNVVIKGKLFPSISAHHHKKILLEVNETKDIVIADK